MRAQTSSDVARSRPRERAEPTRICIGMRTALGVCALLLVHAHALCPSACYSISRPLQSRLPLAPRRPPARLPPPLLLEEKSDPLAEVKAAGIAGIISYFCVEVTFFAIALPIGYFAWHASTGEWLQPQLLMQSDSGEDKVRLVGLILSYVVLLKTLFPVRLGATLLLTPVTKRLIGERGDEL